MYIGIFYLPKRIIREYKLAHRVDSVLFPQVPAWVDSVTLVAFWRRRRRLPLAKSWLPRRNLRPENSRMTGKTRTNLCEPNQRSSILDMTESRLGLGWKAARLRSWCEEGRIRAVRALLTQSPSTPPIRTSEFVIADLSMLSRLEGYGAAWWLPLPWEEFLWRLHRNDPGCDVGEHIHLFFVAGIGPQVLLFRTWLWIGEMERWCIPLTLPGMKTNGFGEASSGIKGYSFFLFFLIIL